MLVGDRDIRLDLFIMTPVRKKKQGLLPVEKWIPVPSQKTAKRQRKLRDKLNPPIKPYKRPRWLENQIREKERKWKEDYEGGKKWVKWYEDRGVEMQTDPVMTFQALGPPPDDEEKHQSQILSPNGELLTLSDYGGSFSSEEEEECSEAGEDVEGGGGDGGASDGGRISEDDDEEEDLPLSKLGKPQPVFDLGRAMKKADEWPPASYRKSERKKRVLDRLAARARARKDIA